MFASRSLQATVGPVLAGTPVPRDVFDCAWSALARELDPTREAVSGGGPAAGQCPNVTPAAQVCDAVWEPVRAYTADARSAQWEQARACEVAREQVRANVQVTCAGAGLAAGSAATIPCECRTLRDTRSGRAFASCVARGSVECGRYRQQCRGG